jgi:hypothetical protein
LPKFQSNVSVGRYTDPPDDDSDVRPSVTSGTTKKMPRYTMAGRIIR